MITANKEEEEGGNEDKFQKKKKGGMKQEMKILMVQATRVIVEYNMNTLIDI